MKPYSYAPAPTVTGMRRRVREAIARHRKRIADYGTREDIRRLMSTRGSGWDDSLWQVWSELGLYRAIHAAERAHRRGEALDRWAIFADRADYHAKR